MVKPIVLKTVKSNRGYVCLIQCNNCGKKKIIQAQYVQKGQGQFCSTVCHNRGIFSPRYKSKGVLYVSIHRWIYRRKGKAKQCIDCGIKSGNRGIGWSNVDHKYSRNLDDYQARCMKCHKKYDGIELGIIPWCKGKKGIHLSPKTEFKKGHEPLRKIPDGKWSMEYERCIECKRTDSKHSSRGLCGRCNTRHNYRNKKL